MTKSSKEKIAPFPNRCYAMVDDPSTDPIISWGSSGKTFVVWDVIKLEQDLLPKYYKHNNFSSFVRQLNFYGFTKYDPDRWEFAHNSFIKGQKNLLMDITRKKSSQPNSQQNQPQVTNPCAIKKPPRGTLEQSHSQVRNASTIRKASQVSNSRPETNTSLMISEEEEDDDLSLEDDSALVWEEVEILKKDKNVVMQELAKLSNHQEGADAKLHHLGQQLEGMEISQQQMLSFLVTVMQNPGFMGQLLQQNESPWRSISETNKKRPFLALEQGSSPFDELIASQNQIVRYQPLKDVISKPKPKPKPILMLPSNCDESSQQFDSSANGLDEFFKNIDLMSSGPAEENKGNGEQGQFVIPDSFDDNMMDKLLASPKSDTADPQSLAQLAAELGILISLPNNEAEGASSANEDEEI
ncbi:hypothetical protein ACHQM5_005473 [Ranunculus cassubicifolius]